MKQSDFTNVVQIGGGTFGITYHAQYQGKDVCLKEFRFGKQEDITLEKLDVLFDREAKTLARLKHPQIPGYIGRFSENGSQYIVMEYVDGFNLKDKLDGGKRFSETEVLEIGLDVLGVLDYLHGESPRVIHRDVKPSNIINGDTNTLVDFGSVADDFIRTVGGSTVTGTYGYAPMELYYGKPSPSSDTYSLGATMIQLLSGIEPSELMDDDHQLDLTKVRVEGGLSKLLTGMTRQSKRERMKPDAVRLGMQALYDRREGSVPEVETSKKRWAQQWAEDVARGFAEKEESLEHKVRDRKSSDPLVLSPRRYHRELTKWEKSLTREFSEWDKVKDAKGALKYAIEKALEGVGVGLLPGLATGSVAIGAAGGLVYLIGKQAKIPVGEAKMRKIKREGLRHDDERVELGYWSDYLKPFPMESLIPKWHQWGITAGLVTLPPLLGFLTGGLAGTAIVTGTLWLAATVAELNSKKKENFKSRHDSILYGNYWEKRGTPKEHLDFFEENFGHKERNIFAHNYARKSLHDGKIDRVVEIADYSINRVLEVDGRKQKKRCKQERELLENICLGLTEQGRLDGIKKIFEGRDGVIVAENDFGEPLYNHPVELILGYERFGCLTDAINRRLEEAKGKKPHAKKQIEKVQGLLQTNKVQYLGDGS